MNRNIIIRHNGGLKRTVGVCLRSLVPLLGSPSPVVVSAFKCGLRQRAVAFKQPAASRVCEDFPGRYKKTMLNKPQYDARKRAVRVLYTPAFKFTRKELSYNLRVYTALYRKANELLYEHNKFRVFKDPSKGFRRYDVLLTSWRIAFKRVIYGTNHLLSCLTLSLKDLDVTKELVSDTIFVLRNVQDDVVHDFRMLDFIWRHRFKLISGDMRVYQHEIQELFLKLDYTNMVAYWKVLRKFCCGQYFVGIGNRRCIPTDESYWNAHRGDAAQTRKDYLTLMESLTGFPKDKELAQTLEMYNAYFATGNNLAHWRNGTIKFYDESVKQGYSGLLDRLEWSIKSDQSLRAIESEITNIVQHLLFLASAQLPPKAKAEMSPMREKPSYDVEVDSVYLYDCNWDAWQERKEVNELEPIEANIVSRNVSYWTSGPGHRTLHFLQQSNGVEGS